MPVSPEHIITLKGKQYVLLTGLLDLAHKMGLIGIETEVLESISDPETRFWAVKATGRFRDASDGGVTVWSAVGDASPASSKLAGAELRHAETRSVARMLRFATNVGVTAYEELPPGAFDREAEPRDRDPDDYSPPIPRPQAPREVNQPTNGGSRDLFCAECGVEISAGQSMTARRRHGRPFCLECRRDKPVVTGIA